MRIFHEAAAPIERNTAIPCTACAYCTHDCPKHIAIPQYFVLYYNVMRITGDFSSQQAYYNNTALANGKASECIKCRRWERACPQHLPITQHLEAVAEKFEKNARPSPTKKERRAAGYIPEKTKKGRQSLPFLFMIPNRGKG